MSGVGHDDGGALPIGTVVGPYRIGRLVGVGGMGHVYLATHTQLERTFALKTLRAANPDARFRARLRREAKAAARIRHPHVLSPTDMDVSDGLAYFVTEYLEGESLDAYFARGPLDPDELLEVMLPVLSGVAAAHDMGVVHRDLKPGNVFLEQSPTGVVPRVLDFGVSKVVDDEAGLDLTNSWALLGTPHYCAPEQIENPKGADGRADEYALGTMVYEGLTGRRPIEADSLYALLSRIGSGEVADPRTLRPELPAGLAEVVLRTLAVDPEARFPSVRELGRALLPFAGPATQARWRADFFERASHVPDDAISIPAFARSDPGLPSTASTPAAAPPDLRDRPPRRLAPSIVGGLVLAAAALAWGWPRGAADPQRSTPPAAGAGAGAGGGAGTEPSAAAEPGEAAEPGTAVEPPAELTIRVTAEPAEARLFLDDELAGVGRLERTLIDRGSRHALRVEADGYEARTFHFTGAAPPPERVRLDPLPSVKPNRPRRRTAPAREQGVPEPPRRGPAVGANQSPILE